MEIPGDDQGAENSRSDDGRDGRTATHAQATTHPDPDEPEHEEDGNIHQVVTHPIGKR